MTQASEVTRLLDLAGHTGGGASEALLPLVYDELRRLAEMRMARESPGQTLQPTALVHEAYLRLVGESSPRWDNRGHFFAAASEAMRRILVEQARRRASTKHGGQRKRVPLDSAMTVGPVAEPDDSTILAVEDALCRIKARDPRMAEIIKLRFFAGLSIGDTASALGISDRTVRREWTFAKAYMTDVLTNSASSEQGRRPGR